eukprot:GILJ01001878.1.p2 GENE.GILJ01001878.1~~GILJ01001878.1.p2  ORF type:complete len:119 (-),score=18.54 GILJ01001878.1:78-434(-)
MAGFSANEASTAGYSLAVTTRTLCRPMTGFIAHKANISTAWFATLSGSPVSAVSAISTLRKLHANLTALELSSSQLVHSILCISGIFELHECKAFLEITTSNSTEWAEQILEIATIHP